MSSIKANGLGVIFEQHRVWYDLSSRTMKAFFRAARKINLGYTVNWLSGSPTVLKNVLNKMRKIKHVAPKKKTSVIILKVFVFNETLVHPKSPPSVHHTVHFFKVNFLVNCLPTIPLNRTKLKYGTMKLKAYEKIIWMMGLGAIFSARQCAIWVYLRLHFLWCN